MITPALPACPIAVTINVDIEWSDINAAGAAGIFGKYGYGRYGLREGFWRLLDMLRVASVPATFFVATDDAERHPGVVEEILEAGHEVAALGRILAKPEESGPGAVAELVRAHEVLTRIAGQTPMGWRSSNGLITPEALLALADQGYSYDSNFENDDTPYVFAEGNLRLAELPVFGYLTDATFYGAYHGPARVAKVWTEEFEALRDAGGYINLTLNLHGDYGSARAPRVAVVAEFLNYVGRQPGTGFMRCSDIAAAVLADPAQTSEAFPGDLPSPITI